MTMGVARPFGLTTGGPANGCSEIVDADHLAASALVHAVGDDERLGAHLAGLSDLLGLGVQPEVGVAPLQGARAEQVDLLVERLAQAADRRAAHALDAQLGHEALDLARTDAVHVGLGDDGHEGLLATPPRLQEAREVAAGAQTRDGQLQAADAGVPAALPVAVALAGALRRTLVAGGAGELSDLHLHELGHDRAHGLTHDVCLLAAEEFARRLGDAHALWVGHRGAPLVDDLGRTPTILGAPVAGTATAPALGHFYTTLRDSRAAYRLFTSSSCQ